MRKKLIIISSIIVILLITSIFISGSLKNDNKHIYFETSQTNIVDSNSLNLMENIESDIVNNITNETITDTINVFSPSSKTTSNEKVIDNNNNNNNNSSQNVSTNKTNTKNNSEVETKKETPNQPTSNKTEEKPTNPTESARPELAYSTYRKTNNDIVPEIIKILNDEISKESDLVNFGSKAVKGNKKDAYAKTTCFTYQFVSDIEKGKVSGNYVSFPQRVRNNVGAFGNYNVYAEDEFTYNGQGLNPKWSQTLVWIYITF